MKQGQKHSIFNEDRDAGIRSVLGPRTPAGDDETARGGVVARSTGLCARPLLQGHCGSSTSTANAC